MKNTRFLLARVNYMGMERKMMMREKNKNDCTRDLSNWTINTRLIKKSFRFRPFYTFFTYHLTFSTCNFGLFTYISFKPHKKSYERKEEDEENRQKTKGATTSTKAHT